MLYDTDICMCLIGRFDAIIILHIVYSVLSYCIALLYRVVELYIVYYHIVLHSYIVLLNHI
jgi:hypothetical protein